MSVALDLHYSVFIKMDIQALERTRYSLCTSGVFPRCAGKTSRIVPLHPQGWTKNYFRISISKWH